MSMQYIENAIPEDAALVKLYDDAGWMVYTQDMAALRRALERSLYLLCAWDGGQLAGLLRAVGDGVSILYIQDILVMGAYRRQGIGTQLVTRTLQRFSAVRQKVLITDDTPEMHGFYNSLGFAPCEEIGLTAFYHLAQ